MDAQEASPSSPTTPAARLIARFGAKRLADWTGRHIGRVYRWAAAPQQGGTGGVIPPRVRSRITTGALTDLNETLAPIDFELAAGESYLFDVANVAASADLRQSESA